MPTSGKNFNPSIKLIQLFLTIILLGTFMLMLPISTVKPISFIDALFTATSAVCVTGLTVRETGTCFTGFGQIVILILIQIGALGYMAFASLLVVLLRKGMNIKGKLLIQQQISNSKSLKLSTFIFRVVAVTFLIELIGAFFLTWQMKGVTENFPQAIYYGVFHSISAFCNAGFDLFKGGVSLAPLSGDFAAVLILSFLIILGGIGYIVINDIFNLFIAKIKRKKHRLLTHTKIVLTMTFFFLAGGTILYWLAEFNNPNTVESMGIFQQFSMAFFKSVTARTAGFTMINATYLINFSIILTIVLMFIGASPGGTGGGIKTTTIAVLAANVKSIVLDKQDVSIYKRRISIRTVKTTVAIFSLAIFFIVTISLIMTAVETFSIKEILFEVTSAFGTVGLSTGITENLSSVSKLLIIITMFLGRLGPLTIVSAMILKAKKESFRYPQQKIAVG